tara:strand:+ start:184 stop:423 length:240 start_codon:yes stop_codon:yes gene_type:complete
MSNLPPQPNANDRKVYNQIRNQLMSDQITTRQVYDRLRKGDFTPGTVTLLHDIIDFGHHYAEDNIKGMKIVNNREIPYS